MWNDCANYNNACLFNVEILVEETLRSTVYCIIVEVFLLKIVLHYVPFENQPDDPLKKLSIYFLFEFPDRVFFFENSK